MAEVVIPSSPVWYQSRGADSSSDGCFAFASRNLIYLLDITNEYPVHYGVLHGHEDRVTTCSFANKKNDAGVQLLSSGGDDSTVKIWNVHAQSLYNEHRVHGSNKVISVHCSPVVWHLVVSGDEKGYVIAWNLEKDATSKFFPDGNSQQQLSCVVCSPFQPNLVAVAYKSGAASIIDLDKKGNVLRKLRGHGNEIQTLVWSPPGHKHTFSCAERNGTSSHQSVGQGSASYAQQTVEGYVVTGSKDRTIRVWSLSKSKCIKVLKLPTRPSKGRRVNDETSRLYMALCWPKGSQTKIISSSFNGDILFWNISETDGQQWQVLSSDMPDASHNRIVFNLCPGADPQSTIISTSMDRYIKCWSLKSPSSPPMWSLPTLGGYVYAVSISPADPSIVALGVGDGIIRIWKVKNPRNPYDLTLLWQGVKEKVMSLAWHPFQEGVLAFGTEDGKVGVYDTLTQRQPAISQTYHMKPVYAMSWGPRCYSDNFDAKPLNDELCLFSCGGEGVILMHSVSKMDDEALNMNSVIDKTNEGRGHKQGRHSDVQWKANLQLVATGNDNGSFDIYQAPHLLHVITVKVHNKIINCLSWCPVSEQHDSFYWIASGSNGSTVCISDVKSAVQKHCRRLEETNKSGDGPSLPQVITEPVRTFAGHTGRITGLSWNPSDPIQLVSASYDGTAQVWNVADEAPVANYRGHDGRLLCVCWSHVLGEDARSGVIYSGGDDYSVHVWKAEKQDRKTPPRENAHVGHAPKLSAQRKRKHKKKKAAAKQLPSHSIETNSEELPNPADTANHSENLCDPDIEALLIKREAELLEEMDADPSMKNGENFASSAELPRTELNPNAKPFKLKQKAQEGQETEKVDEELKGVLSDLSESRRVQVETKEDDALQLRKRRVKNLLPLAVSLDNRNKETQQQDCVEIAKLKSSSHRPEANITVERANLGLYIDRRSAYRMFFQEEQKLVESGNRDASHVLHTWRGDIVGAIEEATERGELTDQLVAMAPLAGYDVWQQAAQSFAEQLKGDGLHLHSSQYFIACHKIHEAIIALREGKLYREAVALARARLIDNDPLLVETVQLWANKLKLGGTFEMAAKCFASIGDYSKSAECLALRASLKPNMDRDALQAMFAASVVAENDASPEEAFSYARKALSSVCLRTGAWKAAHEAARVFDEDTAVYRLILHTHEHLIHYVTSASVASDPVESLFTEPSPTRPFSGTEDDSLFVPSLLHLWQDVCDVTDQKCAKTLYDNAEGFLQSSSALLLSSSARLTAKQTYYQIALLVTTAVLGTCCGLEAGLSTPPARHGDSGQDCDSNSAQQNLKDSDLAAGSVSAKNVLHSGDIDPVLIPLFEDLFRSVARSVLENRSTIEAGRADTSAAPCPSPKSAGTVDL